MSDLRKAAQQALEALEYTIKPLCMCWAGCENCDPSKAPDIEKAITDLRAALSQEQPEPVQEPVAWMVEGSLYASKEVAQKMGGNAYTLQALYTAPPQRPPLTDEEMRKLWSQYGYKSALCMRFARAIERKVRGEA